ncbi:MAG: TetR/AcrR family transcriptional regulator [Desulfitobacterium sp.]
MKRVIMNMEKPNRKKEQGTQTRRKIYESADRLFTKHGVHEVSVDAIVEAAGVSKGTFYIHFKSKDALIASYVSDYAARLDMDYKAFFDSLSPESFASTMLLAMVEKIAAIMADTVGYDRMNIIYRLQLTKDIDMGAINGYGRKLYQMFGNILEQGIRKGEFQSSLPLDILSRHFVMAIRGLCYEWCIRYPYFDLKEQTVEHCRLLVEGITVKNKNV